VLACKLALRLGRHDPNVTSSGGAGTMAASHPSA
jgi:hypothetical protein